MDVTCEILGEGTHEIDLPADATYGDVLDAVGLSTHEASVIVDDSPVPEDRPVDSASVRVIRLIKGG
ncbi:MAG: ubiquitin-like small modifier protein SAMP2 [Halobacteriota archaeon]|uniref:ubiquitin-like small modifier protein SAMP2 n=1 Tax=Natronomonas sp. TaxID=2184060 RepID=UPI0039750300